MSNNIDDLVIQKKLLHGMDWKTLIVLDTCRYDVFRLEYKDHGFPGTLQEVNGKYYTTRQWYAHNWDQPNPGVVMISAHPIIMKFGNRFAKRVIINPEIDIHDDDWVHPRHTWEQTKKTIKQLPNHQYLIHLIPPHLPFIGKKGKQLQSILGEHDRPDRADPSTNNMYKNATKYGNENGWDLLRECYIENLNLCLAEIRKNLEWLPKPLVLTADHGEIIGEDNQYGHGKKHEVLKRLPWLWID